MEVIFDQGIQTDEFLESSEELEVTGFRDGVVVERDRSQLLHDLFDSATLRKNFNSAFAACFLFWRMVRGLWYHVAKDTPSRRLFSGGLTFDKRHAVSCLFCEKISNFL